jgi:Fe-S oxidoreductase
MEDPSDIDLLLWVGCANALLERNHSIVRSVATLLQDAGVRFAVLGREERCTGDPARRIGNEFLFEQMATKNIQIFEKYGVKRLLTCCPHCFHTFKNDYPALGGNYEVEHYTTLLADLVAAGRFRPSSSTDQKITFHDPCYLGRYNAIFDAPRELVRSATGAGPVEMAASRANGFCCGGGGGMAFAEEPPEQRVNRERARQAVDTGADVVAVACPFCMTMRRRPRGGGPRRGGAAPRIRQYDRKDTLRRHHGSHTQSPGRGLSQRGSNVARSQRAQTLRG